MALVIGAQDMTVLHVNSRPGRKPEVMMMCAQNRAAGDVFVMRSLCRSHGLAQCRSVLLLNSGEYHLLQVELPAVPHEEVKEALRWRIKDMLERPVETMTLDVVEVPGMAGRTGRARQGLVAVADNSLINQRMALCDDAGAMLEAIDVPEMAIRNIATLFEEPERGLAVLAFDEDRILLTFSFSGELYAVRQIEISRAKLEQADEDWRQQLFERIGLETQRSLDNFERLHSHINVTRLLVSPLPAVPGLLDYLREYLSLPVAEMDLSAVLDFTLAPELSQPERQAQYLLALGAALRD